jgi:hypothetical protein
MAPGTQRPARIRSRRQKTAPPAPDEGTQLPREPESTESAVKRWGSLIRDLQRAGLSETQARAEASRLMAGDIWSG